MNTNIANDPWILSDEGFDVDKQADFESFYAVGNGNVRQLANFEEYYSTCNRQLTTIVGLPMELADPVSSNPKPSTAISAANWTGVIVRLNEEMLDLTSWELHNFQRSLDMRNAVLKRTFEAVSPKGHKIEVEVMRFLSVHQSEIGAINYAVKSVDFEGRISFVPLIDGKLVDENMEPIWNVLQVKTQKDVAHLWTQIRHAKFQTCMALSYDFVKNNKPKKRIATKIEKENQVGYSVGCDVVAGDKVVLNKYVAIFDSIHFPYLKLPELSCQLALEAKSKSWASLLDENTSAWSELWTKQNLLLAGNIAEQRESIYKAFRKIQIDLESKLK